MAAKKKQAKPGRKAKKKSAARRVKPPRATAVPKELKAFDSQWRRFITKTVPDVPLTEVWEAPRGTPSSKATIREAALKKALKKAARKAKTAVKKTLKKKAATKSTKKTTKKKAAAGKAPARRKAARK